MTDLTTEARRIAARMTERQRKYIINAPDDWHLCAQVPPPTNWAAVPHLLADKCLLDAKKDRPWDMAASSWFRLTPLGLAVRAILTEGEG